jgi:endonuclease YncB( thermonuclease family)
MQRHEIDAYAAGSMVDSVTRWCRFGIIQHVVDGDTFDCRLDLGHRISVDCRFRLFGVNAPERGQPGYSEATTAFKAIAQPLMGEELAVVTWRDKRDKYGRYVADVAIPQTAGKSAAWTTFAWLSDLMLATGTVEEYLP